MRCVEPKNDWISAFDLGPAATTSATAGAVASPLGGYTPMALYRYVYSKEGLVDLMLDEVSAEMLLPQQPSADWRADLQRVATETRNMIKRHPWFASLIHTRPPAGPHMLRRLEHVLAVLCGQGASLADAMSYAALLDRYVIGSGMQEFVETQSEPSLGKGADHAAWRAGFAQVRALVAADGGCPLLSKWLARPTGPAPDQQFQLGLTFLLDGIGQRLGAPRKRKR